MEANWDIYNPNLKYLFDTNPMQRSRMEEMAHYTQGNILEVGANDGYVSFLCMGQGKKVLASDISRVSMQKAHIRGLDVMVCDVRHLPFKDSSFNTVMAGELLEHLPNMGYALAEVQRVSSKRTIISVPHEFWAGDPTHRWNLWFRGVKFNGDKFSGDPVFAFTILIMDKKEMNYAHEWVRKS